MEFVVVFDDILIKFLILLVRGKKNLFLFLEFEVTFRFLDCNRVCWGCWRFGWRRLYDGLFFEGFRVRW